MAKGAASFSEQNAARTMQTVSYGTDWVREFMDQSLNQAATMFEGFLTTARRTARDFDQQASEVRERSMSLASEALSNTLNFAHRVVRAREPRELIQLHSEFMSQQAQAFAEQSKLLGECIARGANEAGKTVARDIAEVSRRESEAA